MTLVLVSVLLSTPSMLFAKSVAMVDTELRESGPDAVRVLTRFDLGSQEQLDRIPTRMGSWTMTQERDWDRVADILNTNVLLSRDYRHPALFQTVNLLVIESTNVSSFHPAPVCYQAQGWTVPAGGGSKVAVPVTNGTWAQQPWLSDAEPRAFAGNVSAKLLEATKIGPDGAVTEKRVALYVYLKEEDWRVTRSVTWLRVEIALPPSSPPEEALPILADLLGEAVPHLFQFEEQDELTIAQFALARYGAAASVPIIAAVGAPVAYIARTIWSARKDPLS